MDRKKVIYIGLLLILTVIVSITYFSYAFFTYRDEQHGKLNIVTGTLDYKIESDDLTNNSITLEANKSKQIEIEITSLNKISSRYELYYQTTASNIIVGYGSSNDTPTGTILANGKKTIKLVIKNKSDSPATITFGVEGGFINNELVVGTDKQNINTQLSICSLEENTIVFDETYATGTPYTFDAPCDGEYKIELWGASGGQAGSYKKGLGGYTSGNIVLSSNIRLYVYVGSEGQTTSNTDSSGAGGGYNGGANGVNVNDTASRASGGGGASDVRYFSNSPSASELLYDNAISLNSRIMVAAGGGGGSNYADGGDAGGLSGYRAVATNGYSQYNGSGGTQTSGTQCSDGGFGTPITSTFGMGSLAISIGGGGGGGYYGGSGGTRSGPQDGSGGGGSSYISGHEGSIAIASGSISNPRAIKSGCTSSSTSLTCSIHYSELYFTNTNMIDGKGHTWTNVDTGINNNNLMPNPNGGYYASGIGHTGNGYARITYLGD